MTTRRELLRAIGTGILLPSTWSANGQQQPAKIPRIGVLWYGNATDLGTLGTTIPGSARFRQRLAELGYVEGKTIVLDMRYADRDTQRLNALARELVASGVDIIVAPAVAASVAARQATSTIPIIMLHAGNPIGAGLIVSLARPGGNVTGTSNILMGGKQVQQLLREIVPRLSKLAVLVNPTNAGAPAALAELVDTARSFGISVVIAQVSDLNHFSSAFDKIRNARPNGLFVMTEPMIGGQRPQILEFAAEVRLPVSSDNEYMTRAGGLISYGPDYADHYAMAAEYVDKILRGAKPADLPVQQPRKFELVINLKTAKALGLSIPQSLLLRADEVIQ